MTKLALLVVSCGGLASAGVIDGNFNSGWSVGGTVANTQVLTGLGPFSATGLNFALLSTGPGEVNTLPTIDSTVLTSILYDVAPGATLTLQYNVLSSEGGAPFGYPDPFSIQVIGISTATLASGDATSALSEISGWPIAAPDGSSFIYETGVQHLNSISLNAFAGQSVSFQFTVADFGDNSFDTGLLVDAISGTGLTPAGSSPVPEPKSFGLVLVLGIAFLVYRHKQSFLDQIAASVRAAINRGA